MLHNVLNLFVIFTYLMLFSCTVVPPVSSSSTSAGRSFRGTIREDAESGDEVELDHELKVVTDDGLASEGGDFD